MKQVQDTIYRHLLSVLLVLIYLIAQTVQALQIITLSSNFLVDLRLCFWLGLIFLLGVETFRNAITIYKEIMQNKKDEKTT